MTKGVKGSGTIDKMTQAELDLLISTSIATAIAAIPVLKPGEAKTDEAEITEKVKTVVQTVIENPLQMINKALDENDKDLREAKQAYYDSKSGPDVQKAEYTVIGLEHHRRDLKKEQKSLRKTSANKEPFSWGTLLGVVALVLLAAGVGVGAAVIFDNASEKSAGNGDVL